MKVRSGSLIATRGALRIHRMIFFTLLASVTFGFTWAVPATDGMLLYDFADGVAVGIDPVGNQVGFPSWQDGSSRIALTTLTVDPGDDLALPSQRASTTVLRIEHDINAWGGFTHAYANADLTGWQPRDLAAFTGIRFWYLGEGRGGTVQFDLFDNRNPALPGDSAERYAYRFVDDVSGWRMIEIPFQDLFRRTDFQPGGAPDDGLTLSETWGWALGFPPGEGVSYVVGVEAFGSAGTVRDDVVTVQFASPVVRVPEQGEAIVLLTLSEPSEEPVSLRAYIQGDTARAMRDLVARSEFLVFPPGETEVSFVLRAIDDGKHEGEERGMLTLGDVKGAELGFLRRAVLVIEDDDPPIVGMIDDFESGIAGFRGRDAVLAIEEILSTTPQARPEQDHFENVLVADGAGTPFQIITDLAYGQDWSSADGVSFWFFGRGDQGAVEVTLLDGPSGQVPWEVVFADEFNAEAGTPPDWEIWTPEIGDGTANGIPGWGNEERQAYTDRPENVEHDGQGYLAIRAIETDAENAPTCYYGAPCEYTSARIITRDAVEFTYGRVEASIRLPSGQGLWPAFWMLGANIAEVPWPASGEIDIVENIGREPSTVHGTIHGPGYSGGDGIGRPFRLPANARFSEDFHRFAVEWEPDVLRWYVDDVLYSTVTSSDIPRNAEWVFDHPFFMILNVAVGGTWPGYPDETTSFPQTMLIDWVRVLQPKDVAERWVGAFTDDVAGWRQVTLPFDAFVRSADQPEGAAQDGMDLTRVMGVRLSFEAGEAVKIDDVRIVENR